MDSSHSENRRGKPKNPPRHNRNQLSLDIDRIEEDNPPDFGEPVNIKDPPAVDIEAVSMEIQSD